METSSTLKRPKLNCNNYSSMSNTGSTSNDFGPEVYRDGNSPDKLEKFIHNSDCPNGCFNVETETLTKKAQSRRHEDITPAEAAILIEANNRDSDLVILDVCTKSEYLKWHLEEAINLNFFSMKFRKKLDKLDKAKTYLVYCKMGGRSKLAQSMMKHIGFKEVYNIVGGRDRWQAEELPLGTSPANTSRLSFCPMSLLMPLFRKLKDALIG